MNGPASLDELRRILDAGTRARMARVYVSERRAAVDEALRVRDEAIVELLAAGKSVTVVARECEVSVTLVKGLRRAMRVAS